MRNPLLTMKETNATVTDPLIVNDSSLPHLQSALDLDIMQRHFTYGLKGFSSDFHSVVLKEIELIKHRPGQSCLIEYTLTTGRPGLSLEKLVLLGKMSASHTALRSFQLQDQLWQSGFSDDDISGFSVPEPMGFVDELNLCFQRKAKGRVASECLHLPEGKKIVEFTAEAAYKLHHAKVEAQRVHALSDELGFLFEKLPLVASMKADWSRRIDRILDALIRLVRNMSESKLSGIHRNYCPDNVFIDDDRLTLLDFDGYCLGDPALDIGTFIGHITEQSLRVLGDAEALSGLESAMENRFIALSGELIRPNLRTYTVFALVKHIYLSSCLPERSHLTESLMTLCEQRLKIKRRKVSSLNPSALTQNGRAEIPSVAKRARLFESHEED